MNALTILVGVLAATASLSAADIVINIGAGQAVSRRVVQYQCDANATRVGLPAGQFSVEYINGGANSLAVLPIAGRPLIFASVTSGSGARYAAQGYIWWEAAGRRISLRSETLSGSPESVCQRAGAK